MERQQYFALQTNRLVGEQFTGAAELVMEVSPDDPNRDYVEKRADYARANVPEYWIVDRAQGQVIVLRLANGEYVEHGRFITGQRATLIGFPDFLSPWMNYGRRAKGNTHFPCRGKQPALLSDRLRGELATVERNGTLDLPPNHSGKSGSRAAAMLHWAVSRLLAERELRAGGPLGYAIAMLVVGGAAAATRLLWDAGDHAIFTLFIGAVAVSSWLGGIGPGLAATLLSEIVTTLALLPAVRSPAMVRDELLRLVVFTFIAILTASLQAATRRAEREQALARKVAENASAAKDQFLAMVSHELRNPLNPVMLTVSALENSPELPPHLRDEMTMVRRNVALEVRLINDLLDVVRCANGKLRLHSRPIRINEPLAAALEICRHDMENKRISLELNLTPENPWVSGDLERLEQVFWNLLNNAIKFTPAGGKISVRTECRSAGRDIAVEISDSGIGIDPQRLETIFAAFEQGSADIFSRFGGLGLGLAICRAMCEAHHGTIVAASAGNGQGATFTVTLPTSDPITTGILSLPINQSRGISDERPAIRSADR